MFVGITYLGSILASYVGSIAGDNVVGLLFNGTSRLLSRPMIEIEVIVNGLILGPISRTTGLPMMLNSIQEIIKCQGLELSYYNRIGVAFDRINNSKFVGKIKDIIIIIMEKH